MHSQESIRLTVIRARIVWAMILMSQIGSGIVAIVFGLQAAMKASPELVRILTIVTGAMLLLEVPLGYLMRSQFYKKNWRGNVITPRGYMSGNIVLWAMLASVALSGAVTTLLAGSLGLPIGLAGIAILFMLINFPTGKPLAPATNPYQSSDAPSS